MKSVDFTGSYSHSYRVRFNAYGAGVTDGRSLRRAAERKRRKEAKRQTKLKKG